MTGPSSGTAITAGDLASLQLEFPAFRIWQEVTGEHARLVAVRRQPGTGPHTVVTAAADELRAVLTNPTGQPATARHPRPWDEYPQAIADEYPGWGVTHHDGQWTAWCPAVTVHATTAAGLRTAIEQAITGNTHPAA